MRTWVAALAWALACGCAAAEPPSLDGFSDAIHYWRNRHGEGYASYRADQVREIADNILLHQRDHGGWVENRDPTRILNAGEVAAIRAEKSEPGYSFDNRNIYTQVAYLMGAFEETGDVRYREGAERGLSLTLLAQMPECGGWPHSVPARNDYHSRLTIADEVMSGNLRLLREIVSARAPFATLDPDLRTRAGEALARGDRCLLDLQIRQNGRLTGWAGQYDPATRAPAGGRSFELPAIVSQETVAVVEYLMSIPDPSPEVIAAVDAAVTWLDESKIEGQRLVEVPLTEAELFEHHTARTDRRLVADPGAPPLWARFYDLADNSVVLANRDGRRVAAYADIHPERRSGYAWYGDWPARLLAVDYPAWKARQEQ